MTRPPKSGSAASMPVSITATVDPAPWLPWAQTEVAPVAWVKTPVGPWAGEIEPPVVSGVTA